MMRVDFETLDRMICVSRLCCCFFCDCQHSSAIVYLHCTYVNDVIMAHLTHTALDGIWECIFGHGSVVNLDFLVYTYIPLALRSS